jgi:putative heme-binding domain-containing protein
MGGAGEAGAAEPSPTLTRQLAKEGAGALAKAARKQGDANRGALVFYRPDLTCTRCHTAGEDGARLGPDLARAGKEATDVYLIESLLLPSKVIKKGFETVVVTAARLSADGRTVTLGIAGLRPTWCMEIVYTVKGSDGTPVRGVVHNTIHRLGD